MTYRINGFKQIEAFYSIVFSGVHDITPQHISLYMFLLNQNNRANWVEWFKCPYDLAMNGAMIGSKKTYYKCLNELKEWKLIDYIAGENQFKAPKISLLRLENAPQLIPQCAPASEPLPIPACEPLPTSARVRYINYISNNFNNLITNNLKQLQDIDFDFENFFVVSLKGKGKKVNDKKTIKPPFSSEDFLDVWNTLLSQPKWKNKTDAAIKASIKIISDKNELVAIAMVNKAIAGGWQGLFDLNEKELIEINKEILKKQIELRDSKKDNKW